jgi:hypothetical protein
MALGGLSVSLHTNIWVLLSGKFCGRAHYCDSYTVANHLTVLFPVTAVTGELLPNYMKVVIK